VSESDELSLIYELLQYAEHKQFTLSLSRWSIMGKLCAYAGFADDDGNKYGPERNGNSLTEALLNLKAWAGIE